MIDPHLQTLLNKKVGRVTSFTFVFWVSSSDDYSLFTFLDSLKVPSCVSPLHDQDIDEVNCDTGEVKMKPSHYHVVIDFGSGNNKTINQCFDLIEPIRTHISIAPFDKCSFDDVLQVEKCIKVWKSENLVRNMRTLLRYFKHLDNPEKHQYFDLDYRVFCGFELNERVYSQSDCLRFLDEIYDFIEENEIYSYWKFLRYCQHNNREWYLVINKPQLSSQVINAIRSFTYDNTGALDKYIEKHSEDDACKP